MFRRTPQVLNVLTLLFLMGFASFMIGCAGMNSTNQNPGPQPPPPVVTVSISPTAATLSASQNQQFQAKVGGSSNTNTSWQVDGVVGGNDSVGKISSGGLYTAPAAAGSHTVSVVSAADPTKNAKAAVTVNAAPPPPPPPPPPVTGMLMQRSDLARTGQNLSETILTPANVNSSSFGKIASYSVDGTVYAQPLYLSNLSIAGGTHNVVIVATEHDSVYAFDADGKTSTPLWQRSFIDPPEGITTVPTGDVGSTIFSEIGITGTPVIDPTTGFMYFVVYTKENGAYFHRLHVIDVRTGADVLSGRVQIQASVPGNSDWGADGNGNVEFNPQYQLQRPGLLLLNGVIYIAFGSHGDNNQYHGWIMAYKASTLEQLGVWNVTPNAHAGAIWTGGAALSADSQGNIYVTTSNGDFDLAFSGPDASDSVLRMTFDGHNFHVADYFTPFNQESLAANDSDLGSAGLTLLPGGLGTVAGKEGSIYLVNLSNLGHYNGSNNSQIAQFLPFAIGGAAEDNNFSTAAYFNGNVYYIGQNDTLKQFAYGNGQLSTLPFAQSPNSFDRLGAQPVVSANNTDHAILWAMEYVAGGANGILHAYDANNVANELYNSTQAPNNRDALGQGVKFSVPTVMNGKVYIGTQTKLLVFGNL